MVSRHPEQTRRAVQSKSQPPLVAGAESLYRVISSVIGGALAETGNEQSNMSSRGRSAGGVHSAQEDPSPTGTTKKSASSEEESNQGMSWRRREEKIRSQQKQRYQQQRRKLRFSVDKVTKQNKLIRPPAATPPPKNTKHNVHPTTSL
ncbi:hypothetical protein ATANTOWER_032656 [Ataeniobius toweri]|uniref:Uncharacterized protein n=1 Tax=Ataeniobius toweri TaxID=208326 RepID=A0ABU7CAS5_9TELE|nr:hypothetical protein [Ataeniobius toweri]